MSSEGSGDREGTRRYAPDPSGPEGQPPTNPVDHVPDAAVSSETTPPDEPGHPERSSGTGVPGASHTSEHLPPGEVGGVDDPVHAMEGPRADRSWLERLRRLLSTGRRS